MDSLWSVALKTLELVSDTTGSFAPSVPPQRFYRNMIVENRSRVRQRVASKHLLLLQRPPEHDP